MGNVGVSELLLLAVIVLLVIGPRRLPEVARTLGRWSGHARKAWDGLKSEFQVEMDRDHNRRILEAEQAQKAGAATPSDSRGPNDQPTDPH